MNVGELIEELQQFPVECVVFTHQNYVGIVPLHSVHAMSTHSGDGGVHGPFDPAQSDAEDFGVLLYG